MGSDSSKASTSTATAAKYTPSVPESKETTPVKEATSDPPKPTGVGSGVEGNTSSVVEASSSPYKSAELDEVTICF